jgi:isocitrate lyase
MNKTLVERRVAKEVYKVTGVIINRTDAELLDFCDLNNFGGIVRRYGKYVAYVTVYTD